MIHRSVALTSVLSIVVFFASASPTYGGCGCGCDKPPPPVASVRPAFASPGNDVTLFAPGIQEGVKYSVYFVNELNREVEKSKASAIARRDFADGVEKPQLVVEAPYLPPGPTSIIVASGSEQVLNVPA